MKTLHFFIIRKGLIAGGIIALIIMLCAGGPAFAARVAGTDENVNTTTSPADTTKKIIKVSPAVSDTSIKQTIPPADQAKQVKTEKVIQTPKEIQDEKLPAHPAKKEAAKKYVTLDFDNVEIGVLVKFVSELTGKNFIIDDKVKGKVTIISPKKIPIGDVYKVFLSVLEINGFTVIPSGNMIKIIPSVSARKKVWKQGQKRILPPRKTAWSPR
jgi:general secretion pathway protein D